MWVLSHGGQNKNLTFLTFHSFYGISVTIHKKKSFRVCRWRVFKE